MEEGFKAWECIVKRGSSEQGREKTESQRDSVRRRSHVGITVGKVGYIWAVWESNYPIWPWNAPSISGTREETCGRSEESMERNGIRWKGTERRCQAEKEAEMSCRKDVE